MNLADLFLQLAIPTATSDSTSAAALDAVLWKLFEEGKTRWPTIELAPDVFVRFLAKQTRAESTRAVELSALHAGDLYLMYAFWVRHPDAVRAVETEYMTAVQRALRRIDIPEPLAADVVQSLYGFLLESQSPLPEITGSRRGYAGRGSLKSWLCTCAVHQAGRLHKRQRRDVDLDAAPDALLLASGKGAEQTLLTGELQALFDGAFREAVRELSSRERNLLRYHFLSRLSIDQIGALYRIHRATAARWVSEARARLASMTRKKFVLAAPMHAKSYQEILELVRSQISLNLATLLAHTATEELAPLANPTTDASKE